VLPILQGRSGIKRAVIVAAFTLGVVNAQLITRPVPPADAVERGQKQFVASCGFCHGATAKGGESGPDLVRSAIVLDDENGDHLGPVILKGRPDRGMPAFTMTQAQISDIAAFLRERTQAAINRREYKIVNIVTGNAAAGKAYFNGAGKCSACHSPTGDLAGIGKKYEPVALQSRFLYPGRGPIAQRKPSQVTVTLPSGQSASGTLENIDDFTIGLRDSEGYYHSWTREGAKVEIRDPYAAHAELLRQYTDADMHNVLAYLVTLP
jgi:cytochrome c oxidase cbb3-type subunit III